MVASRELTTEPEHGTCGPSTDLPMDLRYRTWIVVRDMYGTLIQISMTVERVSASSVGTKDWE